MIDSIISVTGHSMSLHNVKKFVFYVFMGGVLIVAPFGALAQDSEIEVIDSAPPQPAQVSPVEDEATVDIIDATMEGQEGKTQAAVSAPAQELPQAVEGVSAEKSISSDSSLDTKSGGSIPHSGTYYDSRDVASSFGSGSSNSEAPRQVDPLYEPGSTFVVVQKAAGANSEAAKIIAAQRALSLGRNTSALELYEQLYRKNPKNPRILMGLAVAQQQSGFNESAIATYEELLRIEPNNVDAQTNMLGIVRNQYPEVAYRKLKEMWNSNKGSANVAAELGLISATLNNNEEALRYLGIAVSMEPNNAQHYYNMAVVYDRAGAYSEALKLYEKSLETDSAYGAGRSIKREEVYDRLAHLRRL